MKDKVAGGYLRLACAVAERAIADYRDTKRRLELSPSDQRQLWRKAEIEEFFDGSFFCAICDLASGADGGNYLSDAILDEVVQRRENNRHSV